MNKRNYQKELDRVIADNLRAGKTPSLLLHVCCAPCSSYCLEYLSQYFRVTVFYYNPNISPPSEYEFRLSEEKRFIALKDFPNPVQITESVYDPERFFEAAWGLEDAPEGGARCEKCFELRLRESAKKAKEGGFDFFTTTLSISPLKNADLLNEIGARTGEEFGVNWLFSDFKKREGYKRSIELSREYDLYRQNYCGCVYSKRERANDNAEK